MRRLKLKWGKRLHRWGWVGGVKGEVGACKRGGRLAANLSVSLRISQNLSEALKIVDMDDKMVKRTKKSNCSGTTISK